MSITTQASIHQLFEDQVLQSPNKPAILFKGKTVSYQALNERANQIAQDLKAAGISTDSSVGLYTERSLERVIALLAILKAGGTAIPLNTNESQDLVFSVVEAAQISVVLTQKSVSKQIQDASLNVMLLDHDWTQIAQSNTPFSACDLTDNHPIYRLYNLTTAYAKIATLTHCVLHNTIQWQNQQPNRPTALRTLQFSNLSGHTFSQEIFTTWTTGGCLCLIDEATENDPYRLFEALQHQRIERVFLTNRDLQRLAIAAIDYEISDLSLQEIVITGAPLQMTPTARRFLHELSNQPSGCAVHHHYGNATTHVAIAFSPTNDVSQWPTSLPIGKPINNAQANILDSQQKPLPLGSTGELYVASDATHDITSKTFRTGDVARYLPSGDIDLIGTSDQQIDIEGRRINLRDIEIALNQHDSISEAIVIPRTDGVDSNKPYLSAYLLPSKKQISTEALSQDLKAQSDKNYIPDVFVWLSSMPLTASGNIDYLALLKLDVSSTVASVTLPAVTNNIKAGSSAIQETDIEQKILAIWQKTFKSQSLGIHDDFFDLGGHSLIAASVVAKIQQTIASKMTVRLLFECPTVAQLAQYLDHNLVDITAGQSSKKAATKKIVSKKSASKKWLNFSFLVPLRLGDRPALFCMHPAGGSVAYYANLSRALGKDQPFYSLRSPGLDRIERAPKTIEDTAALYIQAIKSVQPEGPYYISGWSLGGIIAYEVARQLQFQSNEVPLLAIFDSRMMTSYAYSSPQTEEAYLKYFTVQLPDFFRAQNPDNKLLNLQDNDITSPVTMEVCIARTKALGLWPQGMSESRFEQIFQVFKINMEAAAKYRLKPKSYSGKTVLWKAVDQQYSSPVYKDMVTAADSSPDLSWSKWAEDLTIHENEANHYTLLSMPNLTHVVKELRSYFKS